jgi:hypothetical protein
VDGEWALWVLVTAAALHVVEEQALGWQGWAAITLGKVLGVRPTWANFTAVNTSLLVLGISCASVGWRAPGFALALPALCLVNALFFHLLPSFLARRPNPGVFTATTLYLPLSIWIYAIARENGVLTTDVLVISLLLGAALMALTVVVLLLGKRFGYPDA